MEKYDLVVVGSGAGLNVLNYGLQMGLKCALVENAKLGATCLTRGCIPSKVLVHPADLIREAEHAAKIGIKFKVEGIDWDLIGRRMWSQIDESKGMEEGLSHVPNLKLYMGVGEFVGDYEMLVKSVGSDKIIGHFKGEKFVLASGARSFIPPIQGLDEIEYITSENFFGDKFPKKPWESLIIIGGGVIAAEFAHIFSAFGTKVTIVEMLPRLVVLVNHKAIKVGVKKKLKTVTVQDVDSGKEIELQAEEIFIAAGRRSNADLLAVERTGVETNERGWVKTNKYLETTKPNIWCFGDANGLYQFRHKANYEADLCANNIFGPESDKKEADYSVIPWAIFTSPQIGHVGMTQKEAIEKGHEIFVAVNHYSGVAKGFAMGYESDDVDDGFVKLVIDKSYKLLGAHAVGPHAAILVQPFVYLMNAGYTCDSPDFPARTGANKLGRACPEAGSFMPVYKSMVIHPSLNEVAGWAIGRMQPVNIKSQGHEHQHEH